MCFLSLAFLMQNIYSGFGVASFCEEGIGHDKMSQKMSSLKYENRDLPTCDSYSSAS